MNLAAVLEFLSAYWVHAMFLFIVLYAAWHVGLSRHTIISHYKDNDYKRLDPVELSRVLNLREGELVSLLLSQLANWNEAAACPRWAWASSQKGREVYQFTTRRKRQSVIWRKKNNNRTKYNATIVSLTHPRSHVCIRPKRALDAIDYMFDGTEVKLDDDSEFSKHYHVFATSVEDATDVLAEPLRKLLGEVEGLSVEVIGSSVVLQRNHIYFDAVENLEIELETGLLLAEFIDSLPADRSVSVA